MTSPEGTPDPRLAQHAAGLTLIELLVAAALMLIVMAAVFNVNLTSTRATTLLQTRDDLIPETQLAQNYVKSKLTEAVYVFPVDTTFSLGSNATVKHPTTGTGSWTVGSDPIVAVVLPPTASAPSCPASPPTTPDPVNCYTFYAYYPVKRSALTVSSLPSGLKPPADTVNDDSVWVLMEYRKSYGAQTPAAAPSFTVPPADAAPQAVAVMDYLLPVTIPQSSDSTLRLFDQESTDSPLLGSTNVTLNLAAQRVIGGRTVRIPAAGRYSVRVYPRNIAKPIY